MTSAYLLCSKFGNTSLSSSIDYIIWLTEWRTLYNQVLFDLKIYKNLGVAFNPKLKGD